LIEGGGYHGREIVGNVVVVVVVVLGRMWNAKVMMIWSF
jgi:hypothetical protein